ncbi:hypothetical protein NDA11_000591 [Ustilago hordei]|uniref:Uncharacterized protein n=1 Tax=Ustilago hordei TaxID=120017 RepID=I2FRI0_USTHO|nr:uncharacterized protein UHO2_05677 [Ustilago hordei]KAJ1042816.1 hypothetical protein NDA10_007979 [Ustilago hordei]KAJ1572860.1 hypothetical protein NDA15_006422 [Ustilago hordei]KAJ1575123.1 hypothetical protein NDA11_000591 [Ustilago hordei]KAJ1575616.1 hypothetical protein NDA12_000103 [Ustilago hordei]KAJ1597981.1 hypothetical protein NDA14_000831 [Ustilago hordei]
MSSYTSAIASLRGVSSSGAASRVLMCGEPCRSVCGDSCMVHPLSDRIASSSASRSVAIALMLHIIGLSVHYNCEARTLSIDQNGYIEGVLTKFGMSKAWTALTPAMETINTLGPQEADVTSAKEVHHFALLVGSLLWIAQGSRPNIAFAIGHCT